MNDIVIAAADWFPLKGRFWSGKIYPAPRTVAVINPGAGIVCRYYEQFASYLAQSGCPALTFDYRGIGRSRSSSLRGFDATVEQWGSKDCAAALDWMKDRYGRAQLTLIGHSVGGFLAGFAENGHLIDKMLLIGAHTGYWRDYARKSRAAMYSTCSGIS